jgi:hypothetical protein
MTSVAPAGWYPDPTGAPGHRWWDGAAWSAATAPDLRPVLAAQAVAATSVPQSATVPAPQPVPGWQPAAASGNPVRRQTHASPTGWAANRFALITMGLVALYILLALETGFVVIGLLPLALSLRSKRGGEALAPFAIGAAVLAIVIALAVISGH